MEIKKKRIDNIPYSLAIETNSKSTNNNKTIENLNQEINRINKKILKLNKNDNLLKNDTKFDEEGELDLIKFQQYLDSKMETKQDEDLMTPEKKQLIGEQVYICNKFYNPNKGLTESTNNIKTYKSKFIDSMKLVFDKGETNTERIKNSPIFNKTRINKKIFNSNLEASKKLFTDSNDYNLLERTIKNRKRDGQHMIIKGYNSSNKQRQYILPRTIDVDKSNIYTYGNYATNKIKFKHPQIYILNNCYTPMRKKLPPINDMYGGKINRIDLLNRNDSDFDKLFNKKQKRYEKYYMAMRIGAIIKYKFH
jgi:hypothetical protein